ncbi:MAG: undecaprenyl/decaprenyl-phosphate alpha-N-acetylglucosaminyl 1-phosphate transferase [Gammaproteobacteria bacterium]|nr:undecaprenyl/decaprenyl-phosphate alpha-N-acetylglucosaminyl 1-phosphate transferase [Gammaproteobacteria bacterium]
MNLLFVLLTAMVISMVIIPFMIRIAPYIGMVDMPDQRKVHAQPVPRVGGIGIVIGSLLAIIIWLPLDDLNISYIVASLILFLFGALDDSFELGHYVKFIGQFISVGIVIHFGDVWIQNIPFWDESLSPLIGKPFTFFAIVGMINAINHSDGLDGLAGGESLLSLCCIAYLAYIVEGINLTIFSLAVIGGVLGFIRFNNHPARIFMGDSGSQFLGFSLAVLTILLSQQVHMSISMALPLLILGLPVIDIIAVFILRAYNGMNLFRASKNHIHHRLLELNFDHYQSVIVIYSVQALFVISAVLFRYEADLFIVLAYISAITLIFTLLVVAENTGWKNNADTHDSKLTAKINGLRNSRIFSDGFILFLKYSIPLYFVTASLYLSDITVDFAIESVVIILLLTFGWILKNKSISVYFQRAGVYALVVVIIYLTEQQSLTNEGLGYYIDIFYFPILAVVAFVVARYARTVNFVITPFDYLMGILVLVAAIVQQNAIDDSVIASVTVKSVIMFYACEILINNEKFNAKNILGVISISAASILLIKSAF